jgi:hypothetical protein
MTVRKDDVRVREHAHTLWEREGKPHGHNDDFWNRAHDEVKRDVEREAVIREKAFALWQEAGCPLWDAERFWLLAESASAADSIEGISP